MALINVLDERLINKIAAGEVIERPASVIKELVENSIDAGSTQIEVTVEDYGKRLIKVSDNGAGMSGEDAKLSILRHATSKINHENDLFNINTLGFRGEALASIAAVSHIFIRTKLQNSIEGIELEVEGGKVISSKPKGLSSGTIIEVRDLFFNTPARLKFLKTDSNELKHIIDIVTRYALINSNISIKLIHNGHNLINSPSSEDLLNNIASVYGADVAKQLMEVKYEDNFISVNGYISKPSLLKSDRSMQSIYVNGRYIKDDTIQQALYDAYHTLLFVNRHPVVLLNIRLDPMVIDVNVHPTKDRIKFEQTTRVHDSIFNSIRETLLSNSLITDYSQVDESTQFKLSDSELKPVKKEKTYFTEDKGNHTLLSESKSIEQPQKKIETLNKLPKMKVLCQILKTFFLAETDDGILLIDQHVVQERILYERFMNQYMNQDIKLQSLLSPIIVELQPQDSMFLQENIDKIKTFGFDVEHFGENSFMLRSVPSIFEKVETKDALLDLVSELSSNKELTLDKKQEEIITRMACRASIKAGDEVNTNYMEALLKELDGCTLPYTCPHGRPIFIKLTYEDLEKLFKRKV